MEVDPYQEDPTQFLERVYPLLFCIVTYDTQELFSKDFFYRKKVQLHTPMEY